MHHLTASHMLAIRPPSSLGCFAQDWVQLARYGHLPVGNLGGDWLLDIADAHFARCLRDAGHLLWITDPSLPDVASRGDDDATEDLLLSADPIPLEVSNDEAERSTMMLRDRFEILLNTSCGSPIPAS